MLTNVTWRPIRAAQDRKLANALGTLVGEETVREPMTDNELALHIVRTIIVGLLLAAGGCAVSDLWKAHSDREIARYAIDRGAWTCGYTAEGKPICSPREAAKK